MIPTGRLTAFVVVLASALALAFIALMLRRRPGQMWIRRLSAIDGIVEAVGRSAEMGRPVVMNIGGMTGEAGRVDTLRAPQYLAGITILSYVAGLCAKYNVDFVAPIMNETMIPLATEAARLSYLAEGKVDAFKQEKMILYIPTYGGIAPLAERLMPGANIMVGPYWGDAMLYADMFGRVGAIQIGGTAEVGSLPYFAAACDYCLIGEEIFAAEAYLNPVAATVLPIMLQDVWKFIVTGLILIGGLATTAGSGIISNLLKV